MRSPGNPDAIHLSPAAAAVCNRCGYQNPMETYSISRMLLNVVLGRRAADAKASSGW